MAPAADRDVDTAEEVYGPLRETARQYSPVWRELGRTLRSVPVLVALTILVLIVLIGMLAPWLATHNPLSIDPRVRLAGNSSEHWLGTDGFGRDVYSRVVYGARVSLFVGLGATVISVIFGMAIGLVSGFIRWLDAIVMRIMDGLMAIPGILLAIALVTVYGSGLSTVIIAIAIPEVPRIVRLVRSVVLTVRTEPYVEAGIVLGTPVPLLIVRHLAPNTIAPLLVQGTFVFASAMMTEAVLSFLGVGLPPELPSWGNVMSEGRLYFQLLPGLILYAGVLLSLTVLSINVLGDALRDALDPRLARRL